MIVFHAQTAYHLALAVCMQASLEEGDAVVVASPANPPQRALFQRARSEMLPGFRAFKILDVPASPGFATRVRARRDARDIRHILRQFAPCRAVTFNPQTVVGRALLAEAGALASKPVRCVAEDGLGTYEKQYTASGSSLRQSASGAVRRLYLGDIGVGPVGRIPYETIDELWVSLPDAIQVSNWPGPRVREIPCGPPMRRALEGVAKRLVPASECERIANVSVLVLPPHSDKLAGRGARTELINAMRCLVDAGHTVGVKYHPRETDEFLGDLQQVETFERSIPAEFLLLVANDNLRAVITDHTTVIVSGARFRPGTRVVTLASSPSRSSQELYARLAALTDGRVVASAGDISEALA